MSFSSIAIEQRNKEVKALKTFLAFSVTGSLVMHTALVASGIVNLLKTPQLEEEPIEITLIELEAEKKPEIKEAPQQKSIETNKPIIPQKIIDNPPQKIVTTVKPIQKIQPQQQVKSATVNKTVPTKTVRTQKPVVNKTSIAANNSPIQSSKQQSNSQLRSLLGQIRDNRVGQQEAAKTGTGNSGITGTTGDSSVTLNTGNNSSTLTTGTSRRRRRQMAVRQTQPKIPAKVESRNSNPPRNSPSSGDGRAACRNCKVKYPERARSRGVEGRVEVALDTDNQGNVTNVRLVRSSGNRRLDNAHLRQARKWKLKPAQSGRRGVRIGTEYAISGSRRYRKVKKQQQARRRARLRNSIKRANQASRSAPRRRRILRSTSTNSPNQSRNRATRRALQRNTPLRSRLRRRNVRTNTKRTPIRRKRRFTVNSRTSANRQPTRRRRRRFLQQSSSSKGNRLRNILRRNSKSVPSNGNK
ncbi:energy transducer TonB [Calothrix rhizosoleniae]|uniref:energy transducer TonB n=1 Tax=Calothrix rhizosoleniae TaxID=888997 RepID=UPI000B49B583|nr:energy transducer TonB [Calothrix rhizosoleniae]